ncbi:glycoside hydrolase family 38 N-terminal domain-containing protein [Paenibacillus psychroresistens]|nr:glycoside hydrolase [Paenibacillus psychroresistens]
MRDLQQKWKIAVIHHSHTDIGYTERQEKIERYHVDFIRQAVEICENAFHGIKPEWQGFRWVCENFWPVERFLAKSDSLLIEKFEAAVRRGDIELTANYLNMTDLIDIPVLSKNIAKSFAYAEKLGVKIRSAMIADINGMSWGYAQALVDAGVEHLFSCLHPQHGMFPLGQKQIPFWWETPNGQKLLVWNGDLYHIGNNLGLVPGALDSYMLQDEYHISASMDNHFEVAETRIFRYLAQLEADKHPYDFVPMMVSGLITDNAPPNGDIVSFIREWNERFGAQVELEMMTLGQFFDIVQVQPQEIPVYQGDWPDWWSDGVGSTAAATKIFREAQRQLAQVRRLDPMEAYTNAEQMAEAEYQLTLYAEHTWGYSSSVKEPWNALVQTLGSRKELSATRAHQIIYETLDEVLAARGEAQLAVNIPFLYAIINPQDHPTEDLYKLHIDYWEQTKFAGAFEVVEAKCGEVLAHQVQTVARGTLICVVAKLQAKEEKKLYIRFIETASDKTISSRRLRGTDGVEDIATVFEQSAQDNNLRIQFDGTSIETPNVRISWETGKGITEWIPTDTGVNLIKAGVLAGAFTPVYEVTPVPIKEKMVESRVNMGRNRKGSHVKRSVGILSGVREVMNGPLLATYEFDYEVPGISYYSMLLTLFTGLSRADVQVRMHKDSVWQPENVYIGLPFQTGQDENKELWLEKTGALVRAWKDQLPGTNTDYSCIQEGVACTSDTYGIAIATPDTPLMQLGTLAYKKRQLAGDKHLDFNSLNMYSWVLNNYWETNFKATVGGFYEFDYHIGWGSEFTNPQAALAWCHDINAGSIGIRLSK